MKHRRAALLWSLLLCLQLASCGGGGGGNAGDAPAAPPLGPGESAYDDPTAYSSAGGAALAGAVEAA